VPVERGNEATAQFGHTDQRNVTRNPRRECRRRKVLEGNGNKNSFNWICMKQAGRN
jgi:hypothetical protein